MELHAPDLKTAEAFASSWNHLPQGSVYTEEQFLDWLSPRTQKNVEGKSVLELGCGNGSLLVHMTRWNPKDLLGIDLGSSVESAQKNLSLTPFKNWHIKKADLTQYRGPGMDFVYCIGVLHHLKDPYAGFRSVLANVKPEGEFHCWVYAWEGNFVVRVFVEPLRRIFSKFPWWITKYGAATPLAVVLYAYAKFVSVCREGSWIVRHLPLATYCRWLSKREFLFSRHVVFDQLVSPQTQYIKKTTLEDWFRSNSEIIPESAYIILRNGNSWKFGGTRRGSSSNKN